MVNGKGYRQPEAHQQTTTTTTTHKMESRGVITVAVVAFLLGTVAGFELREAVGSFRRWRYERLKRKCQDLKKRLLVAQCTCPLLPSFTVTNSAFFIFLLLATPASALAKWTDLDAHTLLVVHALAFQRLPRPRPHPRTLESQQQQQQQQ
ncbi:hypothetical protein PTSG_09894 [Salpingoeca rosetta]|uniref:Uncharacterized protein n=1 Tax=Salpingoeca rosetta (strain ATCC 50818 / BSB-021) TaxID=946362 RepID=F2UNF8_SALR5|nr:uncharacterized protein PTSG_09894 [Salpingoeca rosetta]EGD79163.1 hypothetical protein PTSG_09894 [Salpingoeca rosetta]|eukprot:XP_004989248.1 hypothetical protein PTSG_09894 [Salpingoeca rosetta]